MPAVLDWRELAAKIGTAIMNEMQRTGKKYAIYGHSFGGLLGYLTLLYIREHGEKQKKILRSLVLCFCLTVLRRTDARMLFGWIEEISAYFSSS